MAKDEREQLGFRDNKNTPHEKSFVGWMFRDLSKPETKRVKKRRTA